MESLQMLNVASNLLTTESLESFLEGCGGGCNSLVSLNLSFNKLDHIPDPLPQKASNLTHLYLSGNSISSIPENIASLRYLKVLTLNHNNLASPLQHLRGMNRLQVVLLDGNERLSLFDLCNLPGRSLTLVSLPSASMDPCKDRLERQFLLKKAQGTAAKIQRNNSVTMLESPTTAKPFQPQFNLFDMLGMDEIEEEDGEDDEKVKPSNDDDEAGNSATPPPPIYLRKLTDVERQITPVGELMAIAPPTPVSIKQGDKNNNNNSCFYCNNPIISASTDDEAKDPMDMLLECYEADSPTEKDVIQDFVSDDKVSFHASCHALWSQAQEHSFLALDPRQKFT